MPRHLSLLFLCVVLVAICLWSLPVYSGGGPSGYLVIYDQDDPESVTVANHYQQVRGIPECNMVPISYRLSFEVPNLQQFIQDIRTHITQQGLTGQVQGLALLGTLPLNCNIINSHQQLSLPVILYNSPDADLTNYPKTGMNYGFRIPPSGQTGALSGAMPIHNRTYWPNSVVAPTHRTAMSLQAAMRTIDQAKAADGTRPDGIVYWPLNNDIRSKTRENQIAQVTPFWDAMGLKYSITDGRWIKNRGDIVGGVMGALEADVAAGNHYLPGAWADHLTSFGGVITGDWTKQMPCTDFLHAGAGGSAGTIAEPFAVAGKFPHAHIYTHFRNGASLAEAFWQSVSMLNEIMPVGDPLLQPYAVFPKVAISEPKAGSVVRGMLTLRVNASSTLPLEPDYDLFLDGRRVHIGTAGESVKATRQPQAFTLDTTTLTDGWHGVRVVVYTANAVRTQSEAVLPLLVSNKQQQVTVTGPAEITPGTTLSLTVNTENLAQATSIRIRANGRTLATLEKADAVTVPATALPLVGTCTLYAVALLLDGGSVSSAPKTVTITWPATPPTPDPAFAAGVAQLRYFADTTAPDFAWDTTVPTTMGLLTTAQFPQSWFSFTQATALPGVLPDWAAVDMTKRPGLECVFWLRTYEADVYDFETAAGGQLLIDGVQRVSRRNNLLGPVPLAAAWHQVRLRYTVKDGKFQCSLGVRGGPIAKTAGLPVAWCAAPAAPDTPVLPPVTITRMGNVALTELKGLPPTTTEKKTTLTAQADATDLTYTWSVLSAPHTGDTRRPDRPAAVTFKANGTPDARETTVTFSAAGDYVLQVSAANGTVQRRALLRLTVTPVPTSIWVQPSRGTTIAQGNPYELYAAVLDQFGRRMDENEPFTWKVTPEAKVTPLTGETLRFYPGAGDTCQVTATAMGQTGSCTLKVVPNEPPQLVAPISVTFYTRRNVLTLSAGVKDVNDPHNTGITYRWSVDQAPEGAKVDIAEPTKQRTLATLSTKGDYRLKLTVTDIAGATTTATTEVTMVVIDDENYVFKPVPVLPQTYAVKLGQQYQLYAVNTNGTAKFVWETSTDAGKTWQPLATTATPFCPFGPVTDADATRLFRVTVTNEAGTTTSNTAGIEIIKAK